MSNEFHDFSLQVALVPDLNTDSSEASVSATIEKVTSHAKLAQAGPTSLLSAAFPLTDNAQDPSFAGPKKRPRPPTSTVTKEADQGDKPKRYVGSHQDAICLNEVMGWDLEIMYCWNLFQTKNLYYMCRSITLIIIGESIRTASARK